MTRGIRRKAWTGRKRNGYLTHGRKGRKRSRGESILLLLLQPLKWVSKVTYLTSYRRKDTNAVMKKAMLNRHNSSRLNIALCAVSPNEGGLSVNLGIAS